jgi:serpin B
MSFKAVALSLVGMLIMSACGPPVAMAMSDTPRASADAPSGDVLDIASSMESFGTDLYAVVATGDGNVVFSPASIMTALAMTYAGARGVTAEEMAAVLHVDLDDPAFHAAMNALDLALESRSFKSGDDRVQLSIANSLWGQDGLAFEQPFLDTLAEDYGTGMRLVDFKAAAEKARVQINDWVASQTNDKITDLIPAGVLNDLTRLVLVNAVYLDATWALQFDPNDTSDGSFTTLAGTQVTVPMMRQTSSFSYAKGDGWQAVQLPYSGNKLAMLLIVPDQGRFTDVEQELGSGLLSEAVAGLSPASVALTVPKFTFRTQAQLGSALKTLGMPTAFDPNSADFSGMTTEEQLLIDEVIHEAYIAVDEEGTEAAAATAVVMRATSAPMVDVTFEIDRPFIFALRDTETGALLFLGRVTDPSAG